MMDLSLMLKTVTRLRMMQFYYHYCHVLTHGATFSSDHALFAEFYAQLEAHYDSVTEYLIATHGNKALDTLSINKFIANALSGVKVETMSPEEMFAEGLSLEEELYSDLEKLDAKGNLGMKNLVGDIAQSSDIRQYKIKQRLQ